MPGSAPLAVFVDGERHTFERLRASGIAAPKLGLLAAPNKWELCLDGALVRRDGLDATIGLLRAGFHAARDAAAAAAAQHHFNRVERTVAERHAFDAAMDRLFAEIGRGPWIAGYQHGAGVAQRIDGMRGRLGLGRLTAVARERLAEVFDGLTTRADSALRTLTARGARGALDRPPDCPAS